MSTRIKDVVPVSLSIGGSTVTQQGFGTALILAELDQFVDTRVKTYTSLSGMEADGFAAGDDAYDMASDLLSQTSKNGREISSFKVGRKNVDQNAISTVTFDADATAGTFTLTIQQDGEDAETTATIAYDALSSAVESAIEALTDVTTATVTVNGTNPGDAEGITVEITDPENTGFTITAVDVSSLTGVDTATITLDQPGLGVDTWAEAYSAVKSEDNDFYVLLPATVTNADHVALAAAIEADSTSRIAVALTRDSDVVSAANDDVASTLQDNSYSRYAMLYSEDTDSWANAAWIGATLPDNLYSINTCYYPLTGVVADNLTDSEIGYLVNKNCNRIEDIGGYTVVPGTAAGESGDAGGIVPDGTFIDFIVAKDFLESRLSEQIFQNLILGTTKLPFTNAGLSAVEAEIYRVLRVYGVDNNIVTEDSINVTMPDLDTYDSTKKANRWLDDVVGDGDAQGAISKISIQVNLAV